MSDQVKLKRYIASLKSELEFYKEQYSERQKEEVAFQELEEKMIEMHKSYEKEKRNLLEQIGVLKAFINDISTIKEQPKSEPKPEPEVVVQKPAETELLKQEVQQLTEKLQKVQAQKQPVSGDWFQRVLAEQKKVHPKATETTFRSIQQKLDK
ncbi:hypothetical protein [Bacillus sp. CGMCC 1.16541]|uniref:hypothetical protein n=1 Tax=Bacillus sp. CGMCC 1.16541 TaxID=2185143 RepID=UPI000D738938|nr:hypothetical protein [Bacillus sp. CGMCC 1.16541]